MSLKNSPSRMAKRKTVFKKPPPHRRSQCGTVKKNIGFKKPSPPRRTLKKKIVVKNNNAMDNDMDDGKSSDDGRIERIPQRLVELELELASDIKL
jgi:hypothetical protein